MGTPKKKIKFTDDVEVLDHLGEVDFKAKAGEVKELSAASANRWLRRNKATDDIQGKAKAAPKKKAAAKKDADPSKTDKPAE